MTASKRIFNAAALLLCLAAIPACVAADRYLEIPVREGVHVPAWLTHGKSASSNLILFAGGGGNLKITAAGIGRSGNFLVRSRRQFVDQGFRVVIIDKPSDRRGLRNYRTSRQHAEEVRAVIRYLREHYGGPVWLVGTSRGTISAANAAARLGEEGPDGLVLSATVTTFSDGGADSIRDTRLKQIRVPTLFVHHHQDGCYVCPYHEVPRIMKQLERAPLVELLSFSGGYEEDDNPCRARTRHGFLGIEDKVVGAISGWIKRHSEGSPHQRG